MSYSVTAVGKPKAVADKIAADLARVTCVEPEQTIKGKVADVIAGALSAFPSGAAVRVEASGSQYRPDDKKPHEALNTLTLKIEPLYGFVE